MEQKQKNKVNTIGKAMYAERPNVRSCLSQYYVGMPDIKTNRKHEV